MKRLLNLFKREPAVILDVIAWWKSVSIEGFDTNFQLSYGTTYSLKAEGILERTSTVGYVVSNKPMTESIKLSRVNTKQVSNMISYKIGSSKDRYASFCGIALRRVFGFIPKNIYIYKEPTPT